MKHAAFLGCALALLISCNKKQLTNEELIVGDWDYDTTLVIKKPTKNEPPPPSIGWPMPEFELFDNGKCSYKNGLYERAFDKNGKQYIKYNGSDLKYTFNKNELLLKFPNDSLFEKYSVKKITSDSLIITDPKEKLFFYKRAKPNTNKVSFDKIVVSSSPCYGSCRMATVVVSKDGTVLMNNKGYTEDNGMFIGQLSKTEFNTIVERFNKIDVAQLKPAYSINATDGQRVNVVLFNNNKVYKSVNDYMDQAPATFRSAYTRVMFLSQTMKSKTKINSPYLKIDYIGNFDFKDNRFYSLNPEQETLLLFDLFKSKKTNTAFNPIYELNLSYGEENIKKAYSDGRYFKFIYKDNSSITLDLGYNFIKKHKPTAEKYV